jgi:negative regulator of replication initiation
MSTIKAPILGYPVAGEYLDNEMRDSLRNLRLYRGEPLMDVLRRLLEMPRRDRTVILQVHMKRQQFVAMNSTAERYLDVLSHLYAADQRKFLDHVKSRRGQPYFSAKAGEIESSRKSAQARRIPNTPLWALTNMNRTRKAAVLARVAAATGHSLLMGTWMKRHMWVGLPRRRSRVRR